MRFNRIKYDPELLIHYLFDEFQNIKENGDINNAELFDDNQYTNLVNIIKICKVKVTKSCGAILAHYYAQVNMYNNYAFEFHPGSQPRTFQQIHSYGHVISVMVLCNECCKNELKNFIEGENDFNVAFKNCETILCKRKSMQTIIIALALFVIMINMLKFSYYNIFFVIFFMFLLYINNNYMISDPQIILCSHITKIKNYDDHKQ
ncbi:ac81-like protein [Cryptophlebia peltastica nucleopolyhedrovirus]|uniref:Ac81-like protein n=1 Tax=Cryptophlebia peltastica nucleopolyhedrovirus TaxID=2304025 RepID=A0A346RNT3_9ABAC|nr:ac81-like protein [Cryptophlebia peltastica nucleopolyhedrovirus]AXS67730.1 ac81-like protein [Cryptophlebia peltastica nucleopolyhedrovirus]